nr:GMC oxidoreductase [Cereibacter sediminicola]
METGLQAVVGPELRVRGIDELRVADAPIVPTLIRGARTPR